MPHACQVPCRSPLCGALISRGQAFCSEHRPTAQPTGWAAYTGGKSSTQRGYGRAWRIVRRQVLTEEMWCRLCRQAGFMEVATEVDHITAKAHGGTDDRDNLQPLCTNCSRKKTAREQSRPGGGW